MPQIVFDPLGGLNSFLRQMPIPTLNSYITMSLLLSSVSWYHVHNLFLDREFDEMVKAHITNQTQSGRLSEFGKLFDSSLTFRKLHYAVNHPTLIWVVLNTVCASLAILAKAAVYFTFGQLGAQESELLRDRLCNFLLYKAVFVFGVLSSILLDEMVLWILWFTFISMLTLLQILTMHRFKYFTSSLPPSFVQLRVLLLNIFSLVAAMILATIAFSSFSFLSTSYALFVLADASKLLVRGAYLTFKSVMLLNEAHPVLPFLNSITFAYYIDLVHDIVTDTIDLLHYTHMLLYAQIVLSMACIVLFMQLRAFYKSLSTRINRHFKYKLISSHINSNYPLATKEELETIEDFCAICREQMQNARKLPCSHYFHEWCLRSWLEQDSSCPTCRLVLAASTDTSRALPNTSARRVNHVFRFDGTRYSTWLPRFSFELLHSAGSHSFQRNRVPAFDTSQLNSMVTQVHEMFPQLAMESILQDLRESGSAQATIENILEGRLDEYNASITFEHSFQDEENALNPGLTNPLPHILFNSPSASENSATPASSSGRFSARSGERQSILAERKASLIRLHRKRYIASERGASLRALGYDCETSEARRYDPDTQ
ncbi:unnamed protein product [Enterobius vermicularis]|uniref:CUE domain-containing protein n=1 Tax=Enterobius vermicularis TaxID=51028 RepID=A0A0N4UUX1_ENTVE|nr:unnamed protein product [Enterobius vermicularis]